MSKRKTINLPEFGIEIEIMDDFGEEDAVALLKKNNTNRPQKSGNMGRYCQDMLRKKWKLNGETIVVSSRGNLLNGQNRCMALIKAERMRKQNPEKYKDSRYALHGPIRIPMVIIRGIKDSAADTLDQGAGRTIADVFFREHLFDSYTKLDESGNKEVPEFKLGDKRKLARYLATAVRTCWIRLGGKDVSDAPKFPVSAADDFIKKHPAILDCVVFCYRADGGVERSISSLVTVPYMAAVMYLGATAKTLREDYDKAEDAIGVAEVIDLSLMKQVQKFVSAFASGEELHAGSPILALRKAFENIKNQKVARDRDVTLNMLVKAFTFHLDGMKDVAMKDVKFDPTKEDTPRLGGLDVEQTDPDEEAVESDAEEAGEEQAEEADAKAPAKKKARKPKAKAARKGKKTPAEATA